jgi:hypothetical protein
MNSLKGLIPKEIKDHRRFWSAAAAGVLELALSACNPSTEYGNGDGVQKYVNEQVRKHKAQKCFGKITLIDQARTRSEPVVSDENKIELTFSPFEKRVIEDPMIVNNTPYEDVMPQWYVGDLGDHQIAFVNEVGIRIQDQLDCRVATNRDVPGLLTIESKQVPG